MGVASGRLCVVAVAACAQHGEQSFETAQSIARFRPPITAALG